MARITTWFLGAAVLVGLWAPALADSVVHRGHGARHRAHSRAIVVRPRAVQVVGPAQYEPLQPDEFVDPANPRYIRGVDDGSRYDTEADGVGVGREPGDLVPRDGSSKAYARSGGPGFEIDGPPIYRTLPVVPELVTPELY